MGSHFSCCLLLHTHLFFIRLYILSYFVKVNNIANHLFETRRNIACMCVCACIYIYIYTYICIYLYIYIYKHLQVDNMAVFDGLDDI